jgi:hypothetical protein
MTEDSYRNREDLGKQSFKDLRALGVGVGSIRKCEKLLGRFFTDG